MAIAVALGSILASAAPSEATPSRQITIPSPDAQPFRSIHLGVDNSTTFFRRGADAESDPTEYGLSVGLPETFFFTGEVGIDLKEPSDDPVYLNAKLVLKEDSAGSFSPAVAGGIFDLGFEAGENDYNVLYMLLAKTVPVLGRISAGMYYGSRDLLLDAAGEADNYGYMLSWDRTIAEFDSRLWLCVDYMSQENLYGAIGAGFGWRFAPNIGAVVGYKIFNEEKTGGPDRATIQFDIDF